MIKDSIFVKNKLSSIIKGMEKSIDSFVVNPKKDFTRNRKLKFEDMIKLLLSMGGNTICKELLDYFEYDSNIATTSAFVQQREKILPSALKYLFEKFTNSFEDYKTFNGYRLLAIDGSKINIPHNPKHERTYIKCTDNAKGFNMLNLNALFDLENKVYTDIHIQPIRELNEHLALTNMVDKSFIQDKVILVADRGYESYNNFAHIEEKGWKYIIRVKDKNSTGMVSSFNLPSEEEFDKKISLSLTRRQTKEIKSNPGIYKSIPKSSKFDYLELRSKKIYPISFRVIRIKITENNYETIITNLEKKNFSAEKIKEIYKMRWGIETSFRELKYSIGLIHFHSKGQPAFFPKFLIKLAFNPVIPMTLVSL